MSGTTFKDPIIVSRSAQPSLFSDYIGNAPSFVGNWNKDSFWGIGSNSADSIQFGVTSQDQHSWDNTIAFTLKLPNGTVEAVNHVGKLNGSMITIGATVPTTPTANDVWIDTSTTSYLLKVYSGSAWVALSGTGGGSVGPVGPVGPTGPAGPVGPQGANGANGAVGATGTVGPQGPAGSGSGSGPIVVSSLPTPNASYRYLQYILAGSAGVPDKMFWCKKLSNGMFDWYEIA
jgi:hypothetical protein